MTPFYDRNILPGVVLPIDITPAQLDFYLGGFVEIDTEYNIADIEIRATNNTKIQALYSFWKNDCAFGTSPFLINLPIFGTADNYLCRFKAPPAISKIDISWKVKASIEIICKEGDFTVDADGNYVVAKQEPIRPKIIYTN